MPPNFDKMSRDELWAFWRRYVRPTRKDAEALVGDRRPGFTNVAACLASVACNTAVAMECRTRGDELAASVYETGARLARERLPKDLR